MTDLSQVIRWNAGFVRGLAQSVLDRAKTIRSTLTEKTASPDLKAAPAKTSAKKPASKRKATAKRAPARKKRADA